MTRTDSALPPGPQALALLGMTLAIISFALVIVKIVRRSIGRRLATRAHSTRVTPRKELPPEVLEFFERQGAKGGKIGSRVRAANMTPEERSEASRNAVQARGIDSGPTPRRSRVRDDALGGKMAGEFPQRVSGKNYVCLGGQPTFARV